ncbi:endonuclease domain-containing protein [Streptomyces sp. NPDC006367]|uniref:endonuclease domain-containing protein n=1 Tax=unclassified Streptomyces TaxID=2593676 RepID=UPI0033A7BD26
MSHSERAAYRDRHPQCQLCRRRPTAAVDHDAVTGQVRGAVCRSCNSWLGSMEAALRVPRGVMQQQAAYLHWRFEAGGPAALAHYAGELSYLGTTVKEFADGLLVVRRLLRVPCVYWTDQVAGSARETRWTKTGPLADAEEAERHHRRLRHACGAAVVVTAFEPDDGVNSPSPRGLVKPFTGSAQHYYGSLRADLSRGDLPADDRLGE